MVEQETNVEIVSKTKVKSRYRRLIVWFVLVDLAVAVVVFYMLLHQPGKYNPPVPADNNQVSTYLTHELLADFYNNVQLDKPFDLIVEQKGIADIIAHGKWPWRSDGVALGAPAVVFEPGRITLMGLASLKGINLVVTVVVTGGLDEQDLLHVNIGAIRIGAVNVTFFARIIARKMYERHAAKVDTEDFRSKIAKALFVGTAFEPILKLEDHKVRIGEIEIMDGQLVIGFVPNG